MDRLWLFFGNSFCCAIIIVLTSKSTTNNTCYSSSPYDNFVCGQFEPVLATMTRRRHTRWPMSVILSRSWPLFSAVWRIRYEYTRCAPLWAASYTRLRPLIDLALFYAFLSPLFLTFILGRSVVCLIVSNAFRSIDSLTR